VSFDWRYTTQLSPGERLATLALLNEFDTALGREAIDENRRRLVQHNLSGHFWIREANGQITGFANEDLNGEPSVEMAGGNFDKDLANVIANRHETFDWWIRDARDTPNNLNVIRALRYMELDNIDIELPASTITTRAFVPGVDDERWLAQNNAAFASHPEQGAWNIETLRTRIAEPWFDPSGFLLFLQGETLVASCWTKIHEFNTVRTGEIYVISVHPEHQGKRLGRFAVLNGLASIRSRGVNRASLYVDDSNEPAIAMYKDLGFSTVRTDQVVRLSR
jgi:ribosomal protein S18 acetylase RimI-like enzyme